MKEANLFSSRQMALEVAIDAAELGDDVVLGLVAEPAGAPAPNEHINSAQCWCSPTLVYTATNGSKVYEHHGKQ